MGTEGGGPGGVRRACTRMLTSGCLKPDATPALVLARPADCLGDLRAVVVIQLEAALPMSRAMRPPVRHRPVFPSAHSPALDPAVSAAATRKRDHHPHVCLSPIRHVISERSAVDGA
jgi:hypothetical protein